MNEKCIICGKKKGTFIVLNEKIITGKTEVKIGKKLKVHSKCIGDSLSFEWPGFIYGRITPKEENE
tara:strand:+ start:1836 stop:2033 length:198 start_codon:yes stop_codon:yes gene_type:complete